MRIRPTLIPDLIRGLVADDSSRVIEIDDRSIQVLCSVGLGPAAYRLTELNRVAASAQGTETLQGADMTTRLIYQRAVNAVTEYAAALHAENIRLVLLKGMSVASAYYDPPQSRVMGDVDLLVARDDVARAAEVLGKLGYLPDERESLDGPHHHLPAVRHQHTGIIIELHTGLFPPGSIPAAIAPFAGQAWSQYMLESRFNGLPVLRLAPTMQLAYSIAHWAIERKWPVSVFPFFDAAHLASDPQVDWDLFLGWMNNDDWFANSAALMLTWLDDAEISDLSGPVKTAIANRRRHFGRHGFRTLLWLMRAVPLSARGQALWFVNQRAARAAWRSMLAPETSGNLRPAIAEMLRARLTPLRTATMSNLRSVVRTSGYGDFDKRSRG